LVGAVANQASRLEGLNKVYGTEILASGEIAGATADRFVWRHIDRIVAVGTTEQHDIHEPLGEIDSASQHAALLAQWETGRAAYGEGRFEAALACFRATLSFRPGDFVMEGEELASVLPASATNALETAIQHAVMVGQHRTLEEDVEFAFAQLSEIAIRALSPAINDTYTSLSSIDYLGDALRMFAVLPVSDGLTLSNNGKARLLIPPLLFARAVRAAFDLIRQAAINNPAVCVRLLQTCGRLAAQLHDNEQRKAIREHVDAVYEVVKCMPDVGLDRYAVEQAYRLACDRLAD